MKNGGSWWWGDLVKFDARVSTYLKGYEVLKDGSSFVDRFKDSKSGYVFLEKIGKHIKSNVRTLTIFRHQPGKS